MSPSFGLQTPQAITTASAVDLALVGLYGAQRAVDDLHAGYLDVGYDGQRAGGHRFLTHQRAGAQRVDHADRGCPEGADDLGECR